MSTLATMRAGILNAIDDLRIAIEDCETLEEAPSHADVREADVRIDAAVEEMMGRYSEYVSDLFTLADRIEDEMEPTP